MASLSSRRAWIEIRFDLNVKYKNLRRSPHGERGLKSTVGYDFGKSVGSLSSRRAWIEINAVKYINSGIWSLSSRRAWIEM